MVAGFMEVWRIMDFFYQHFSRLEYVDKKNGNIFRVVFCRYRGPRLITRDGIEINDGDKIVKLHIHNYKLTKMLKGINNEARLGLITFKVVKESLPKLASYIEQHPNGQEAKAIIGTTFLHRGVNRLGFDVANVPDNLKFKIKNDYLKLLLIFTHPNGAKRLQTKPQELNLKRVYISKDKLVKHYAYTFDLEGKL